jgi:hypothetical protein
VTYAIIHLRQRKIYKIIPVGHMVDVNFTAVLVANLLSGEADCPIIPSM